MIFATCHGLLAIFTWYIMYQSISSLTTPLPPGKTPMQFFWWVNSPPLGKKEVENPCPPGLKWCFTKQLWGKVCTISFERPVNYLCNAWHVFPPKYEAWTHFNRRWTEYQCQGVVWTLLIIFTESLNRSTCLSVYLIITRLRNVNLLCFSESIEGYRLS